MARAYVAGGVERLLEAYSSFKNEPINKYVDTEGAINSFGYRLLNQHKIDEAITVFELNVRDYPQSWNVYDSLAEAYMNAGQNELAVQFYNKSLELNPDNTNAVGMLERLGAHR